MFVWGTKPSRTCATSREEHRARRRDAHRQVVQRRRCRGAAVQPHVVLERADLLRAARQHQVLCADRIRHVAAGDPACGHRGRVEVDQDLPLLAAVGGRHRCPLDGREPHAQEVVRDVVELVLCEAAAGRRDLQDRHVRRVVADDQRWRDAGRHLPQLRLRGRRHLALRAFDGRPRVQEDLHHAQAGQ
jgi:hypothetical protein